MVTFFAFLMMAFPYYGHILYPEADKEVILFSSGNIQEAAFNITGMTSASCEEHVKHAVNELSGIVRVSANSEDGTATVKFDNSKTDETTISEAINRTGYKVAGVVTNGNPSHGETGHICGPNGCE
jgi:copper chaperone CopZ